MHPPRATPTRTDPRRLAATHAPATGDACVAQTKSKRPSHSNEDWAQLDSGGGTRSEQSEDELSTAKPGEVPTLRKAKGPTSPLEIGPAKVAEEGLEPPTRGL